MALHSGWDSFMPQPGTVDQCQCRVCGDDMAVRRDVNGPTGFAEAMGGGKHLHDHFYCMRSDEPWHRRLLALRQRRDEEVSPTLRAIIDGDIAVALANRGVDGA